MTAGWGARTVRAAVFAAVCVLLAALGHVLMSGSAVPWWTVAAGFAGTCGLGWSLAGRERGLLLVVSATVLAQGALHSVFSWAQSGPRSGSRSMSGGSGTGGLVGHLDMAHSAHMTHSAHMADSAYTGHAAHMGHAAHLGQQAVAHDMGGISSFGMLAAHVTAALLSGLWLAHGERAAFRLLRTVAGWLAAPLRLPTVVAPVPAYQPVRTPVRERAERVPGAPLADPVLSRGPPAGTAVG
ncbi:hypothetical protein ABZ825_01630 [Streptomyces tauricus]|uniref:hypothetical protein n=1 Tax=Streptomyces tauricus TaxID=68274 RepID=UPI0033C967B0